jgi:hypothetical protein
MRHLYQVIAQAGKDRTDERRTLLALRFWGLKRPDPTSGARKLMHVASLHAGPIPDTGMAR